MSPDQNPLVTLLVFTYNQSAFIAEAVESALAQDYVPLQIIISDDNSTDDTFDVANETVRNYSGPHEIIVRRNGTNQGLASHLSSVVELAAGEIICWAAGDDVSLPGKIESLVTPLIKDKTLVATHSFVNEIDADGVFIRTRKPDVPWLIDSPLVVIQKRLEIISQSHAFRRSVRDTFGPLSPWVTNEGAVMAFREACLGGIHLVKEPLTNYRVGVGVSTRRGTNTAELAIAEPTKYARWWASGYRQIVLDAIKADVSPDLLRLVMRKADFYAALVKVNETPLYFTALFAHLFRPGFNAIARAFVRRNTPQPILSLIYRRRGWLVDGHGQEHGS